MSTAPTSLTKLACQRVQDLTPYLSARRIGGKGHVFLNANEAPKSEQYTLDSSRLNRYPECQPDPSYCPPESAHL